VRVLYVNHTAIVSGGEHSLLALLGSLPAEIEPLVATPRGDLMDAVRALGIPVRAIAGTAGSLRLHPVHTTRALTEMGFAATQVRRAAKDHRADIVHANSIRAGIVLALARPPGAARVSHVRDCLPPGPVSTATLRFLAAGSTAVVANSAFTAARVRAAAPSAALHVIHNPVDLARFDPARIDRNTARSALGETSTRRPLLGVVAQITPWKGQHTAVEVLRRVREDGLDAHLLLIGAAKFLDSATRFDNAAYVAGLREQIARAGLEDRVSWLGQRDDVPELMRALDVLLLPSEEEPFGRAVIEAMALEVPVLATRVGGPAEIIDHGVEGRLLDPADPQAWAQAVVEIAADPERARAMGRAGRARAERDFSVIHHVTEVVRLYRALLEQAPGAP
jgi:L-malate glycosyltransferase